MSSIDLRAVYVRQSAIKASTHKNKKDKKKDKKNGGANWDAAAVSFADGPAPGEGSDGEAAAAKGDISAAKAPVQMTADELADEEWGPVKDKGKKGKKGKKKGKAQEDEDEDEPPGKCFPRSTVPHLSSLASRDANSTGCG